MTAGDGAAVRRLEDVDLEAYDFFDFGAGDGGSVRYCEKAFGGRGLGIDVKPSKAQAANDAGVEVVLGDILALPRRPLVRYVSMCDFLEHLPDDDLVREVLEVAAAVATDFIYIKHPSFEDEAYLRALGLKQYWQDWKGHPSHLLLSDLTAMLTEVGARRLEIEYVRPITDSDDATVLPLDTPPDQGSYDPQLHGPKPHIVFEKPVHRAINITAHLDARGQPLSADGWRQDAGPRRRGWSARVRRLARRLVRDAARRLGR